MSPVLLLLVMATGAGWLVDADDVFHNQFAVQLRGGAEVADGVARRHGFVNRGQIGSLADHYLFEHPRLHRRSVDSSHHHVQRLEDDPQVLWAQQQKELVRVKRDVAAEFEQFPAPSDPMFSSQWFLAHGAVDGSDMNVLPAWAMGATGKGVVVTILDDGIQTDHPDLIRNYDPMASTDINGDDEDPTPQDNGDNKHGTRCAGEVAAEAYNSYCGVGVAYNASIGGVRMLDGLVNDAVEAKALSLNKDHIDIYSASWGPEDDGKTVDGPGPMAKKAFVDGVKNGRKGKGSIFVWASGNGGRKTDNCNCDGYTNSIFTLSISSASQGGRKPWYLEECSSTLATTYSSGTPSQDSSIATVDQDARLRSDKLCTTQHTGTSASAPLAAGICALALEVNPGLTWRDMQHLVVRTSNARPLQHEPGWMTNAVGRNYSHKFGYGLMDAAAMVSLARRWTGSGRQLICETDVQELNANIAGSSSVVSTFSLSTEACGGTDRAIAYLEHVQCKVSLRYNPRGALHVVLVSPSGTRSSLLLPRPRDHADDGFEEWPFLSVHFWGERANGTWTLEVRHSAEASVADGGGILKRWKLFLYGTKEQPFPEQTSEKPQHGHGSKEAELMREDEEFANGDEDFEGNPNDEETFGADEDDNKVEDDDDAQNGNVKTCHVECSGGCTGPHAHQCSSCKNFKSGTSCVASCSTNQFGDASGACQPCDRSCGACFGPSSAQCTSCAPGLFYLSERATCVQRCPRGHRAEGGLCARCADNCAECSSSADGVCAQCRAGFVLSPDLRQCAQSCPSAMFVNATSRACQACHDSCSTCVGSLATQCATCKPGTFYFERKCLSTCPEGHHPKRVIGECVACPRGCSRCAQDESQNCVECKAGWKMDTSAGICHPAEEAACQVGTYSAGGGQCRSCHPQCAACTGAGADACLSCRAAGEKLHIDTCVDECPASTFASAGGECRHCPHACLRCSALEQCSACHADYFLAANGRCVTDCGHGFARGADGRCAACHSSCRTCVGPAEADCASCAADRFRSPNGTCVERCPSGTYASSGQCWPCHPACQVCTGPRPDQCAVCGKGLRRQSDGSCASCAKGRFFDAQTSSCSACSATCATCSGGAATECASCARPLVLAPWNASCVACCDGRGQRHCCHCDEARAKCLRPATLSERKRSFREEISVPSRSAALLFLLLCVSVVAVIFLLRSFQRSRRRKRTRRLRRNSERERDMPLNAGGSNHAYLNDGIESDVDESEERELLT